MMLSLDRLVHADSTTAWLQRLVAVATVLGWLLVAALIASLYVGHSSSPYGTCPAANGRTVSCSLLHG